MKAAGRAS